MDPGLPLVPNRIVPSAARSGEAIDTAREPRRLWGSARSAGGSADYSAGR